MSDDVVFLLAGGIGTMLGLWQVVNPRYRADQVGRLLAVVGALLVGALLWDSVKSVARGQGFLDHRADSGAFVLLGLVMILPIWGLFDERLLARVSGLAVVSIGLAVAHRTVDDIGEAPALALAVGSISFLWLLRNPSGIARMAGYGWFLAAATVLAGVEMNALSGPLGEIGSDYPSLGSTVLALAALTWLTFHGWFAVKYLLIVITCVRRAGRDLAVAFSERVVHPMGAGPGLAAGIVGVETGLLLMDHQWDWASDRVITAVLVLVIPVIEQFAGRQ
ncbi:MAG: hypothetical protein GY929_17515 [Actinomycetia bacterium]|nr:hypothetical protein [Actinomycetes bacterium]